MSPQSDYQPVCKTDEIGEGQSKMFVVGEQPIAVFRIQDDFFALRNECPHAGASLAHGYLEGDVVRCRIHHWGFCVRDGRYVDHDTPSYNAQSLPLRVVENEIQVALP